LAIRRSDKVSIIDVARRAGVSTATAGRVLGGYGYASDEIRDKVAAAAAALGYRPNRLAKGLITGATQTIGVVAADIEDAFYASALRAISDVARSSGFGVIVTNSDENLQLEASAVQLLLEKQVDGIIVSPSDLKGSRHLHEAVASGRPIVQIDRVAQGLAADSVTVDNVGGTRQCVERLIEADHRDVGFVAELLPQSGGLAAFIDLALKSPPDPLTLYPSWQRLLGYLQAHRGAGLPIEARRLRPVGVYSAAAAKAQTLDLLRGPDRPTALVTADSTMSRGAMEAINELGLAIPADLSLICFDDVDWMKFVGPGISAVSQPIHEVGKAAAELLLGRIDGNAEPALHMVLPVQLIERGSVQPPGRRVASRAAAR
jgi:LacI family transcriptional regulator